MDLILFGGIELWPHIVCGQSSMQSSYDNCFHFAIISLSDKFINKKQCDKENYIVLLSKWTWVFVGYPGEG